MINLIMNFVVDKILGPIVVLTLCMATLGLSAIILHYCWMIFRNMFQLITE